MEKRLVLVTGGSGGLGTHIVKAFSEEGYEVLFTYNHNNVRAEVVANDYNATAFHADSLQENDIKELAKTIQEKYGKLDALVYAAGIFEDSVIHNMQLDSWNRVIAVNLTAPFLYIKHFTKLLRNSGSGRFVCIGSVIGDMGVYGSCSYAATKAGLIGLVKSVALENASYGVTANVVSYGYIDEGMTKALSDVVLKSAMKKIPMKKLGNPDDAAKIVVDVCSEHFGYVSGQVIRNNGLLYV